MTSSHIAPSQAEAAASSDLGDFRDMVEYGRAVVASKSTRPDSAKFRAELRQALAFDHPAPRQGPVTSHGQWVVDGLRLEELSWDVGYGPRTRATVVRPDSDEILPGVLALHCHGHFKYHGSQKLVDGPDGPAPGAQGERDEFYGGRAVAMELARQGFVVLSHDTFLWGSRGFSAEVMRRGLGKPATATPEVSPAEYNALARDHEHIAAKYCSAMGFPLAAVINNEDHIALSHLTARADVRSGGVGIMGFSGGGQRASYLAALSDEVKATVIVGAMSSQVQLMDHHVAPHTWMLFPGALAWLGDWPDVVAAGSPAPLLVLFGREDEMFTKEGMESADQQIRQHYSSMDAADQYSGEFFDVAHKFSVEMQERAFDWFGEQFQ